MMRILVIFCFIAINVNCGVNLLELEKRIPTVAAFACADNDNGGTFYGTNYDIIYGGKLGSWTIIDTIKVEGYRDDQSIISHLKTEIDAEEYHLLVFPGLKIDARELDFIFHPGESFKRHPIMINSEGVLRHAEGYDYHGRTFKLIHDFFNAAFESGLKEKFQELNQSLDFTKRLIFTGAGVGGGHARHAALQFGSIRYKYYRELDPNLEREYRYKMAGDHWAILTFGSIPCMDQAGMSHFDKFFPEASSKCLIDVSHERDLFRYLIAHNTSASPNNAFFRKEDSEIGWAMAEQAEIPADLVAAVKGVSENLLVAKEPLSDERREVYMSMLDFSKVEEVAYHLMRVSREHERPLIHLKTRPKITRDEWLAGAPRKEVWEYYGVDHTQESRSTCGAFEDNPRSRGAAAAASGGESSGILNQSTPSRKPSRRSRFFASLKKGAAAAARGATAAAKVAMEVGVEAYEAYQEHAAQEREREAEFQVQQQEFMRKLNERDRKRAQQRHNHAVTQRKKWNDSIREKKEQLEKIRAEKKSLRRTRMTRADDIEINLYMDFGFSDMVELESARRLVKQKKADRDTWERVKGLEKRVNIRLKGINDKIDQLDHQDKRLVSEIGQLVKRVKESREKEQEQRFY